MPFIHTLRLRQLLDVPEIPYERKRRLLALARGALPVLEQCAPGLDLLSLSELEVVWLWDQGWSCEGRCVLRGEEDEDEDESMVEDEDEDCGSEDDEDIFSGVDVSAWDDDEDT